jgi:hypothetical protein
MAGTRAQSGDRYGSGTLHSRQFLLQMLDKKHLSFSVTLEDFITWHPSCLGTHIYTEAVLTSLSSDLLWYMPIHNMYFFISQKNKGLPLLMTSSNLMTIDGLRTNLALRFPNHSRYCKRIF